MYVGVLRLREKLVAGSLWPVARKEGDKDAGLDCRAPLAKTEGDEEIEFDPHDWINSDARTLVPRLLYVFEIAQKDILANRWKSAGILVLGIATGWAWGIQAGILWPLFASFLIFKWDSRIVGVLAILALILCPNLIANGLDDIAELVAVWAYFFLVITVVLQFFELKYVQKYDH